jgi:hypothetical protein
LKTSQADDLLKSNLNSRGVRYAKPVIKLYRPVQYLDS